MTGPETEAGEARLRLEELLSRGEAANRAGDWDQASDVFLSAAEAARGLGDAEGLAQAALGVSAGRAGFEVRRFDQNQIKLLEEALETLPGEDSSLRAWVMARLSAALGYVGPDELRVKLSREAAEMAERVGDPAAHAYALSTYCDVIVLPEHAEERLEAATQMVRLSREAGDRELELLGRRHRVVYLLETGDISALDAEIAAYTHLAETLKHPIGRWYVPLFGGMRALMEGRYEEGEQLARRALGMGKDAGSRMAVPLADFTLLTELYRQAGRFDQLDEQWRRYVEAYPAIGELIDCITLMRATVGRADAKARAELERLAASGTLDGIMPGAMWLAFTVFLAEAAAGARHRDAAQVLYRALRPYGNLFAVCGTAGCTYGVVYRVLALLADVQEDYETAERHYFDALDAHRRAGALPYLAHTQREYAAMLLRWGREGAEGEAFALLDEATDTYRRLGMAPYLAMAEALRGGRADGDDRFQREGQYWTMSYEGKTVRLNDSKGVRTIALLMRVSPREVHVLDLIAESGTGDARTPSQAEMIQTGLTGRPGDAGEVLDAQARSAYKKRIAELEGDLEEATALGNEERAAQARAELDFIAAELASAYGLGGRTRSAADPVERARKTVKARISRSINAIGKEHPALAHHLQRSITTGSFCSYQPEQPVDWIL